MRIVINARVAQYEGSGVPTYGRNLLSALSKVGPEHEYVLIFSRDRSIPSLCLPPNSRIWYTPVTYQSYLRRDMWEQIVLPIHLRRLRADVYHHLDFSLPYFAPCPMVTSLHDTIAFSGMDDRRSLALIRVRTLIRIACRRATQIITLSHNSRKDIECMLGVPSERISVTYLAGTPPDMSDASGEIDNSMLSRCGEHFVLNIGSYQARKNRLNLMRAFAQVVPAFPKTKLVFTGKLSQMSVPVTGLVRELGLADNVVLTDNVSRATLNALLQRARVLAYPSICEGFGLPLLDAMSMGVPVICSASGALAEVAGDAALKVDPYSIDDMATAMRAVLRDKDLRNDLIARGRINNLRFSWEQTACDTLTAYRVACRQHIG